MKRIKFDAYDGVSLFGGLVFFAPAALLVRTQAGVSEAQFFLLQALLSGVIALGEIPTGRLTDRIGYRNSIILSQGLVLAARGLLAAAFWLRSLPLFIVEAVVEGFAICFSSGTDDAYLYALCGEENYLSRSSHAANFGTAGFIVSAVSYAALYRFFGLSGLLLATILSSAAGFGCSWLLAAEPQQNRTAVRSERAAWAQLGKVFKEKRALLFTALLSLFSVAWLLVNFFYVEKLQDCGLPIEWMSAIIIAYSAFQMLAEPIIGLCGRISKKQLAICFCLLGGAGLILFGNLRGAPAVLPAMIVLPLLLSLAGFYLSEQQNKLVDEMEMGGDRAAALSAMNAGVSLVEVVSLFASSALAAAGAGASFTLCGALIAAGALIYLFAK